MAKDPKKEFKNAFMNFWNQNKIDFKKMGSYFSGFTAEEQKKKIRLEPPATKVINFLTDLKEAVSEDEQAYIYTNFKDLYEKAGSLTEFLDEHGYDLIDAPEIKELSKFINGLQILGMQYGASEDYEFYQSFKANKDYLDAEEETVYNDMVQFYADVDHDDFKASELSSEYETTSKRVAELKKQYADYENKLEDLKTVDDDIKIIGTQLTEFEGLEDANYNIDFYTKYYNIFDPNKNEGLTKADQSIKDLNETQVKLKAEIDNLNEVIQKNPDIAENYKQSIEACKHGVFECQEKINTLQQNNYELRKDFFNNVEVSPQDIDTFSKMTNSEFALEIKDYLDEAIEQKNTIINSEEYKALEQKLADKVKLKESDKDVIQEKFIDSKIELKKQTDKLDKLQAHITKAKGFQKRVDKITEMRDQLHADIKDAKKPNRFELLEKSLKDIKAKFDKIPKGKKNSPEFDDMYSNIDAAINALKTGDPKVANNALETLDSKTVAYADAKSKQTRWFPSTLRKLRLQTNEELHNICSNRNLIAEDVNEMEDIFDNFSTNYKPGNSAQTGKELMSKAKKQYDDNAIKYIKKIDHAEVEHQILNMKADLLVK